MIILNFNDYRTTKKLIELVRGYNSIDKIIIVDNMSTDDSYDILKSYVSDKIDVIHTNKNGGYAFGNNYGMKYAEEKYNSKYYTIANPDISFKNETLNSIIEFLDRYKKYAIATAKVNNVHSPENSIVGWKLPKFKDDMISVLSITNKLFNNLYYDNEYLSNDIIEVDVVPGSFFVVKAEVMKKIGYFDEDTFLYCEERILAYKLKEKKYKSAVLGNITYDHIHGKTIKQHYKKKVQLYKILQQSKRIYLKKYLKINKFKQILFNIATIIGYLEKIIIGFIREKS